MNGSLSGRVAIVTGAGRGIGRATALTLAGMGAGVVVADVGRDEQGQPTAEQVADEIRGAGGKALAAVESVTDDEAVAEMVARAESELGSVDILVNNAGIAWQGAFWECDPETFERVTSIHIRGSFYCMRHVVPGMRERGWGRIVNLVSRAGVTGLPHVLPYGAAKGGVLGLTNAASRDLGSLGITVNAVNPASTLTPMVLQSIERYEAEGGEGLQRAAALRAAGQQPEQVAIVISALCTEEAGNINGQIFMVERDRVGLFQPLTVVQAFPRGDEATVSDMTTGLSKLDFPDLSDPYA